MRRLVEDGRLDTANLAASVLSCEQPLGQLRHASTTDPGAVPRACQQANGSFSIILFTEPRPGLRILPAADAAFCDEQEWQPAVAR